MEKEEGFSASSATLPEYPYFLRQRRFARSGIPVQDDDSLPCGQSGRISCTTCSGPGRPQICCRTHSRRSPNKVVPSLSSSSTTYSTPSLTSSLSASHRLPITPSSSSLTHPRTMTLPSQSTLASSSSCFPPTSSSSPPSSSSLFSFCSLFNKNFVSPLLTLILIVSGLFRIADACSSRSTPKPRPPSPTSRPNITFQTYACPEAYAKWYCLNGATCFSVRIGESILYNCECVDGYMGQRCEFKDLDGSYLPRDRLTVEKAGLCGGAALLIVVFFLLIAFFRNKWVKKDPGSGDSAADDVVERKSQQQPLSSSQPFPSFCSQL